MNKENTNRLIDAINHYESSRDYIQQIIPDILIPGVTTVKCNYRGEIKRGLVLQVGWLTGYEFKFEFLPARRKKWSEWIPISCITEVL